MNAIEARITASNKRRRKKRSFSRECFRRRIGLEAGNNNAAIKLDQLAVVLNIFTNFVVHF